MSYSYKNCKRYCCYYGCFLKIVMTKWHTGCLISDVLTDQHDSGKKKTKQKKNVFFSRRRKGSQISTIWCLSYCQKSYHWVHTSLTYDHRIDKRQLMIHVSIGNVSAEVQRNDTLIRLTSLDTMQTFSEERRKRKYVVFVLLVTCKIFTDALTRWQQKWTAVYSRRSCLMRKTIVTE